jgi:fatty acid synthase subunit beta
MDAQAMARSCALDCEVNLFSGLHARSRSYTFYCKDGLLGTTQFAQPALVVTETAAFAHLRQLGRVPPQSRFAGHSLGEFAALSVMTAALPLRAALKTVFTRGALMQAAVPRDTAGRSGFGMVAVDPSRVGNAFQEKHILEMVQAITVRTGLLLEMVNLNVKGQQYVCAGDKRCLHLLQRVTDELHAHQTLSPRPIADLVAKHAPSIAVVSPNDLVLVRGEATMPLKGIDVPFHSTQLACMGGAFRHTLVNSISRASVRPEDLIGRWIPNVTGKPFATDRKYVQLVAELTGSPRIVALLAGME